MRARAWAWATALVGAVLGGCSILTDTSDLVGGGPIGDASAEDSPRDGSRDEDARGDGATADGGSGPGSSPPCSAYEAGVLICDEFERTTLNGFGLWTLDVTPDPDAGVLAIEPLPDDAGRALHVGLPNLAATFIGQDEPHLRFESKAVIERLYVAYDLTLRTHNATSRQLMVIRFEGDAGSGGRIYLSWKNDVMLVVQQDGLRSGTTSREVSPSPIVGVPMRWELEVDAVARTLIVSTNGQKRIDVALLSSFAPSIINLSAGFRFGDRPSDALDVTVDNFVAIRR